MTHHERGTLVLRIEGLVFVCFGLVGFGHFLLAEPLPSGFDRLVLLNCTLTTLFGLLLMAYAWAAASVLLGTEDTAPDTPGRTWLRMGIVVLALDWAFKSLTSFVLFVVVARSWSATSESAAAALVAVRPLALGCDFGILVVFAIAGLAFSGRLAGLWHGRVTLQQAGRALRLLAVGLALVGLWTLVGHVRSTSHCLAQLLGGVGSDYDLPDAEAVKAMVARLMALRLVACTSAAALALIVVVWPARIARLLHPKGAAPDAAGGSGGAARPRTVFTVAAHLVVFYLLGQHMEPVLLAFVKWTQSLGLVDAQMFGSDVSVPDLFAVPCVLVTAALGILLSAVVAPLLGRLCYRERPADAEVQTDAGRRMLSLSLGVLALYFMVSALPGGGGLRGSTGPVVIAWLLILVLRTDIAWWMFRGPASGARSASDSGRAFRVGLILLGAMLLLRDWPNTIVTVGSRLCQGGTATWRPTLSLAGIALVLLAGPLSRWLSYGRFLPKLLGRGTPEDAVD